MSPDLINNNDTPQVVYGTDTFAARIPEPIPVSEIPKHIEWIQPHAPLVWRAK